MLFYLAYNQILKLPAVQVPGTTGAGPLFQQGTADIVAEFTSLGLKASAESIPSEDSVYDLVTCTFAIRHMNIEEAFGEFIRVLKPKGKIVIADIYAPEKWRGTLGKIIAPILQFTFRFSKYKAETKSKVLTINEWKSLFEGLGLTIIEIVEFPGKKEPEWQIGRAIMAMGK